MPSLADFKVASKVRAVERALQTSTMLLFEFKGGPWVVAPNRTAACAMAGVSPGEECRELSPDESFTMLYDDVPDGADEGPCEHGCDDGHNHVTMTAREWCAYFAGGKVIREYA